MPPRTAVRTLSPPCMALLSGDEGPARARPCSTVRRWGGAVHEAGVTLLFLRRALRRRVGGECIFATASRALVSAAGIMVELFLGSAALWIWFSVQPGTVRDVAFVTLLVAAASTFLVNGNPLLRFMATTCFATRSICPPRRAKHFVLDLLLQRYALGRASTQPVPAAAGERKWLVCYAPCRSSTAWFFRAGSFSGSGPSLGCWGSWWRCSCEPPIVKPGASSSVPCWRAADADALFWRPALPPFCYAPCRFPSPARAGHRLAARRRAAPRGC